MGKVEHKSQAHEALSHERRKFLKSSWKLLAISILGLAVLSGCAQSVDAQFVLVPAVESQEIDDIQFIPVQAPITSDIKFIPVPATPPAATVTPEIPQEAPQSLFPPLVEAELRNDNNTSFNYIVIDDDVYYFDTFHFSENNPVPVNDYMNVFQSTGESQWVTVHNTLKTGWAVAGLKDEQYYQVNDNQNNAHWFRVIDAQKYQATNPYSPHSDFIPIGTVNGEVKSAGTLHSELKSIMADGPTKLIFQTCIEAEGNPSWGRLFVIMEEVDETSIMIEPGMLFGQNFHSLTFSHSLI